MNNEEFRKLIWDIRLKTFRYFLSVIFITTSVWATSRIAIATFKLGYDVIGHFIFAFTVFYSVWFMKFLLSHIEDGI